MDQQAPANAEAAASVLKNDATETQEPASKRAKISTPEPSENKVLDATTSNILSPHTTQPVSSPLANIPDPSSEEQKTLDAIHQLQQLEATQSQLAQVAATDNFQFLANFENSIAASVMASPDTTTTATTTTHTGAATPILQPMSPNAQPQDASTQLQKQQQQINDLSMLPAELLKRELMNQKVRADNRERKKRWRQQNEERNKDNDLRCRVNKRAHKLFGKEESEHKKKWIEEEFAKRRQKRKEKERRKGLVDDSLGGHHHSPNAQLNTATSSLADGPLDLAALVQHLQPAPLSSLSDANYLTLLCNNLGIPAAARSIIGSHNAASSSSSTTPQQQQQQPEEQQQPSQTPGACARELQDDCVTVKQEPADIGHGEEDKSIHPFPFQLLELLHQLQQYQPTQQQNDSAEPSSSSSTADTQSTDYQLSQLNAALLDRPEEKLAVLLASSLQAAVASQMKEESETKTTTQEQQGQENMSENNTTINQQDGDQQLNNNSAEFPMDAVLTLMQLNAGWRH
ncbi:hypothetical protein [Parasitella parasitica]|uniref:DUF3020 domain-containing protein n=1 Tax=Parasitella parasitica TaxID=35722 RepID=A0A0B7MYF8_9FUNG|nr:hypothetical protein [Parasitella parasitica]